MAKKEAFNGKRHTLTAEDRKKAAAVNRKKSPRSIQQVRDQFNKLQEGMQPHVREWVTKIADGVARLDEDGAPVRREDGSIVYEVSPDPKGAIDTYLKLSEFVIPRLKAVAFEGNVNIDDSGNVSVTLPPWMTSKDADVIDITPED